MKASHETMPQNLEKTIEGDPKLQINKVNGEIQEKQNSKESGNASEVEASASMEPVPETIKEPIDLEKLYSEDILENPDAEFDIEGQIKSVETSLTAVEGSIDQLKAVIESKKAEIARVKGELGMEASKEEESIPEEQRLEQLLEQKEGLEAKKEEAEEMEELQELMDEIDKMPPEVRIYIIHNGTTPEGKPLQTKSGKEVNKEVAMSLAKSIEEGVKKLTKAVLKVALGIVKGVFKGIFAVVKGEMSEQK